MYFVSNENMSEENLNSVYKLTTSLCEKFTNDPSEVRKLRTLTYEILLKKKIPEQNKECPSLTCSGDSYCNLLAWHFLLINNHGLRQHADYMKEYADFLQQECYKKDPDTFNNILKFLLCLKKVPDNDGVTEISSLPALYDNLQFNSVFKLPQEVLSEADKYFNSPSIFLSVSKNKNDKLDLVDESASQSTIATSKNSVKSSLFVADLLEDVVEPSVTSVSKENIWDVASKSQYCSRRNWENYGLHEPDKEKPFLTELGEYSSLWVENLYSLFMENYENGIAYKSQPKKKSDFIRDVKYVLVGLGSGSFNYNKKNEFFLIPGTNLEGITPTALRVYSEEFVFTGTCYKALNIICTPEPYTSKYKQNGHIFKELCISIKRYLSYYRTAVFTIPDSTTLLLLCEKTRQLRNQINTLAKICKVGPYLESEEIPKGVSLLNYLYHEALCITDKKMLLVIYSIIYSCCQVYFSRFLKQWILDGILNDPYNEFLIKPDLKYLTTRGRTYWTRSYILLNNDIVPHFLQDLGQDILNCGKGMNLLKLCVPSSKLCLYLMGKKPPIISCCLTSDSLKTLEQNITRYYLEVSTECGPKLAFSEVIMRSHEQNMVFMKLIAKKRSVTLRRIELERQQILQDKLEKRKEEMAALREQYDLAMEQKQLRIAKEIQNDLKLIEDNLNLEAMRDKLIEEEANNMIQYYSELFELTEKRRIRIDQHIERLKSLQLEQISQQQPENNEVEATKSTSSYESLNTLTSDFEEPHQENMETSKEDISEDSKFHSSLSLDVLNANSKEEIEDQNKNVLPLEDEVEALDENIKAAIENFEAARKNKQKVLNSEMGNNYSVPQQSKLKINTNLTEAQLNKIRVLSSEFGIEVAPKIKANKILTVTETNRNKNLGTNECFLGNQQIIEKRHVTKILSIVEINRNKNLGTNECFLGNRQIIEKKQLDNEHFLVKTTQKNAELKKSTSLQLDFNKTNNGKKEGKFEFDKPIPMSVDSTPLSDLPPSTVTTPANRMLLSLESKFESFPTTSGTHFTDDGFDFNNETEKNKENNLYFPLKSVESIENHKKITTDEASSLNANCLKLFLHESIAMPLTVQLRLVNNELLKYFVNDLSYLKHLQSLRDYFFLQDGEFGRNITENLFEKLYTASFPMELINFRTLQYLVFSALENSRKYDGNSNCLSFQINNLPDCFDLGDPDVLDCLCLKYKVKWPLNILLPVDTVGKYDMVFKHLLKVHRISWIMKKIVLDLKILAKQTGKKEIYLMMSPHYRRVHQCRHVMMHFIQSLQNYIVGEVFQSSWELFERSLANVTNLDELYSVHTVYLKNILFMCFLNQRSLPIRKIVHKIFIVILKFYDYLRSASWSCEKGAYVHPNFDKLESIYYNFEEILLYFYKVSRKLVTTGHQPHLMHLLDMLDINDYYKNKFVTSSADSLLTL